MEEGMKYLIIVIGLIIWVIEFMYRVSGDGEDTRGKRNRRMHWRGSRYQSNALSEFAKDFLEISTKHPDLTGDADYSAGEHVWKCPDCGKVNHNFQDTCSCGFRKNG